MSYSSNSSTWTTYWYRQANASSAADSSGTEAVVTVANATVRAADGCESSRYDSYSSSNDGYYSSYYGSSSSYGSASSYGYARESERCGQGASATTGVTTVGAGNGRACESENYGYSSSWSEDYGGQNNGQGYAYSVERESCSDGIGANAGSERVFVGERSSCDASRADMASWGWNSYTRSYESSDCTTSEGVYGPHGLAVFTTQRSGSYEMCEDGECESDAYESEGVGVSHDYVGTYVFYLA